MKQSISKVAGTTNRLNLLAPTWYYRALNNKPNLIDDVANGVGSETSWTYCLTPDTIALLNINSISHPHDIRYSFPLRFASVGEGLAWKRRSDYEFFLNGVTLIEDYGGWLKGYRLGVLDKYMVALNIGGSEAFWANKELPDDYFYYYEKEPEFELDVFNRYTEIWEEICNL